MNEDTGTSIQNQNLIGDDVADEISAAIKGDQMNGSVTPPTVVQPTHNSGALIDSSDDHASDQPADDDNSSTPTEPTEGTPADQPHEEVALPEPVAEESAADSSTSLPPEDADEPAGDTNAAVSIDDQDRGTGNFTELQAIKQGALTKLGPLVQHLDQDPQERFDTLLMMIRASDDATLVQTAYEAAEAITDDKKKAQALLDIVNEVNYLTRPKSDNNS